MCRGSTSEVAGKSYWTNYIGTYTWAITPWKGDKYEGEFKEDVMHGKGTYSFSTGDKFIGRQSRNSLQQEVGVGSFFYIFGTGDYKKLIGKKCYYTVKYLNINVFYKHKCN